MAKKNNMKKVFTPLEIQKANLQIYEELWMKTTKELRESNMAFEELLLKTENHIIRNICYELNERRLKDIVGGENAIKKR